MLKKIVLTKYYIWHKNFFLIYSKYYFFIKQLKLKINTKKGKYAYRY